MFLSKESGGCEGGLATLAWRGPYALRYIGGTRPGFTVWSVKLLCDCEWFHRRIKTLAALHSL